MTARRFALAAVLSVGLPAAAGAQPDTSFERLAEVLKRGDTVIVEGVDGEKVKGDVIRATPEGLVIEGRDWTGAPVMPRTFAGGDVAKIQRRDRISDGLFIGLGVGVAAAVVAAKGICSPNDPECEGAVAAYLGLPMVAGAAAIGTIVDLLHRKTLFESSRGSASATVSIGPLVGRRAGGAALSIGF